ncbi:LuxR C-terminal-related transcriptional regulator [Spongiactinospora sp. TRM90649]|uniref:LuxR C-terminal-related transcriptional regulator n=1 Tax=Spongiactinospora sp. TRM90649 TaxID=3031114 RepID=UPI0023F7665B|nr:LuxR C-terminal-related transcriptional regulator [Spongiactinospora sp. TRM90649]MDF5756815.1 LuxR C-terminal-related transcriptional regulator [Spongiactinospora sp. TRM90649]
MAERRHGNLPAEMTSFIGRTGELSTASRMFAGGRLVTVTGPAGVGKSRLALRVADGLRRRFPDGLWHVELSPIVPAHVRPTGGPGPVTAIAEALGLAEREGRPGRSARDWGDRRPARERRDGPEGRSPAGWAPHVPHDGRTGRRADREEAARRDLEHHEHDEPGWWEREGHDIVARALRDRRALILLDTCEHLLGEVAPLIEELLAQAPRVCVLATGRSPLGLAGERVLRLDPLPLTDLARPDPSCPSVALFAERAVAVDPDFSLTPGVLSTVTQVCTCLDGLPLAIELAAARTRSLSIGELLERLDDMTTMPGWGAYTASPRHRDLRGAIAWSHELCRPDQRQLWEALAVIEGGFGLDTARRAVTREGVLVSGQALDELVDRSILLRSDDLGGQPRYRMLETYRRFFLDPSFGPVGRTVVDHRFAVERWSRAYPGSATTSLACAPQPVAAAPVRIGRPVTGTLTPRELEVAELIAEGLSNPQIAVRLLIAKRTVDAHVRNILAKGGLASRTQVAAWFAERTQWADA